jgi:hypothetical protein
MDQGRVAVISSFSARLISSFEMFGIVLEHVDYPAASAH